MTISEHATPKLKKPRGRPPIVRDFYGSAMDAARRTVLKYAGDVEGLDKEIALLRTKLREAVEAAQEPDATETPQTIQLMIRGMELLVKLVAARYRISKKAEKDIADSATNLIRGLANELYPGSRDDP